MLFNDPIHTYVPLQWELVPEAFLGLHLAVVREAAARKAIEVMWDFDNRVYWRRCIDLPEMELGL